MKVYFRNGKYIFFADREQNLLTAFYQDDESVMYIGNSKIYDVLTREGISHFAKELMERNVDIVLQKAVNNRKLLNRYMQEYEERKNSFFLDEYDFIGAVVHYIEKSTLELCIVPALLEFNTVFLKKGIIIAKLFKGREDVTEEDIKKANRFIDTVNLQINKIKEVFRDESTIQNVI